MLAFSVWLILFLYEITDISVIIGKGWVYVAHSTAVSILTISTSLSTSDSYSFIWSHKIHRDIVMSYLLYYRET